MVEILDESGWCRDPERLLLLSGCEEDYRDYTAKQGADAAAFQHLQVAKDDQYESNGTHLETAISSVVGIVISNVTCDKKTDQCAHLYKAKAHNTEVLSSVLFEMV